MNRIPQLRLLYNNRITRALFFLFMFCLKKLSFAQDCRVLFLKQYGDIRIKGKEKFQGISDTCLLLYEGLKWQRLTETLESNAGVSESMLIENPSAILKYIPFEKFTRLQTLVFIGNEYNSDALPDLPINILNIPTLREIRFEGVRFPLILLNHLRQKYPHIAITGEITNYQGY